MADADPAFIDRLLRRDRLVVAAGLAVILAVSWVYLARISGGLHAAPMEAGMDAAMGMGDGHEWGAAEVVGLFLMWTVMMAAMMLPSAAPVILLVINVYHRSGRAAARSASAAFSAGYLLAWTTFSALAATIQVVLHRAALLSPAMVSRSTWLAGGTLLIAGIYQWTPVKNSCLTHCRSPIDFLTRHWREGVAGALSMGLRHGFFCVGCCWALMALLFAAGVMNLMWVAAIAAFVLVEKLTPQGVKFGRLAGALLVLWAVYVFVRAGMI
jgi:predicted metal-binding membrane protein